MPNEKTSRRSFCQSTLAVGLGGAAVALPVYGGVRMALAPWEQTGLSGKEYPLTTLENLDATPRLYAITDTVRDAWVSAPNQSVGNVFLRKITNAEGAVEVEAFQSVCPHAGCRIKVDSQKNPKTGNMEPMFYCPCHADLFTLDGDRIVPEKSKSARNMDRLETRIDESGRVLVKFQNFRLGCAEKSPI